jgi:branched-chain amino acid aminotransferase
MSISVFIQGRVVLAKDAMISVLDRGFLFGDSIYETLACVHRKPVFLKEHLDRLERSGMRIGLVVPARKTIETAISQIVMAREHDDCRLRVIVTRGVGPIDLDPATASHSELIIIASPINGPNPNMLTRGVAVEIVGYSRGTHGGMDPAVKSGNYLTSVLAIREARSRCPSVHEAILCTADGQVAEGASSNVFIVSAGKLLTPALTVGILEGVTRGKVILLAKASGISVEEAPHLSVDELKQADEVFLTSAVRGILPVTQVDGGPIGIGLPGPITSKLLASYQRSIHEGG